MDPERYLTDRERLATRLRDLRQNAGLTGMEAARRACMSQPKISKLENGRLLPSVEDVQTLLDLYQAGSAERDALLEVAGRLHSAIESNRTILRRGAARRQARLGELEHEATTLRYFSPIVIPGLLQTAEYMRRVFPPTCRAPSSPGRSRRGGHASRSCTTSPRRSPSSSPRPRCARSSVPPTSWPPGPATSPLSRRWRTSRSA